MKDRFLKYGLFWMCLCLATFNSFAQHHTHSLSAGIGFPNLPRFYFNQFNYKSSFSSSGKGPFHLKYEYRAHARLGLGVNINYMTYKVSYTETIFDTILGQAAKNTTTIKSNNTALNLRANYHILNPEKHTKNALYIGLGIGYRFGSFTTESDYPGNTVSISLPAVYRLGLETTIGWRHKLTKESSFYLEMGPAKSFIQGGLCIGFNPKN